jgi:hypothetical protein
MGVPLEGIADDVFPRGELAEERSVIRRDWVSERISAARRAIGVPDSSAIAMAILGVPEPELPREPKITAKMLKNRIGTRNVSIHSERLFFNRLQLV